MANEHLEQHLHREVGNRFDTIVVDEAQDFRPSGIVLLERLLDPGGPPAADAARRPAQGHLPTRLRGPVGRRRLGALASRQQLPQHYEIASLLHHQLGGPPAPVGGPETLSIRFIEIDGVDAVVEAVGDEIDRLIEDDDRSPDRVLVQRSRDQSATGCGTSSDSSRGAGDDRSTICEKMVHRVAGSSSIM